MSLSSTRETAAVELAAMVERLDDFNARLSSIIENERLATDSKNLAIGLLVTLRAPEFRKLAIALRTRPTPLPAEAEDGELVARTSNISMEAYARWASRALNRLSGGGSEMFIRLANGEFYADPDMAVDRANERIETLRRLNYRQAPAADALVEAAFKDGFVMGFDHRGRTDDPLEAVKGAERDWIARKGGA